MRHWVWHLHDVAVVSNLVMLLLPVTRASADDSHLSPSFLVLWRPSWEGVELELEIKQNVGDKLILV